MNIKSLAQPVLWTMTVVVGTSDQQLKHTFFCNEFCTHLQILHSGLYPQVSRLVKLLGIFNRQKASVLDFWLITYIWLDSSGMSYSAWACFPDALPDWGWDCCLQISTHTNSVAQSYRRSVSGDLSLIQPQLSHCLAYYLINPLARTSRLNHTAVFCMIYSKNQVNASL